MFLCPARPPPPNRYQRVAEARISECRGTPSLPTRFVSNNQQQPSNRTPTGESVCPGRQCLHNCAWEHPLRQEDHGCIASDCVDWACAFCLDGFQDGSRHGVWRNALSFFSVELRDHSCEVALIWRMRSAVFGAPCGESGVDRAGLDGSDVDAERFQFVTGCRREGLDRGFGSRVRRAVGQGKLASIDPTLTTVPRPRTLMPGSTRWVSSTGPKTLS